MEQRVYTIDIDTGGTFTDGFVVGDRDQLSVKVETTPHDLTICFRDCIQEAARRLDVDMAELLDQTRIIRFSSTIATNTAVQHAGPKLGIIVTGGKEGEALYAGPGDNPIRQFLAAGMVVGVAEAIGKNGKVEVAPSAEEIDERVRYLLENGARTLVVSLANAHVNPANEVRIRDLVNTFYPRHYLGAVPMLLSHQVTRVPNDALRTNTAIMNGYFHPELVRTLYKAEDLVRTRQYRFPLMIATADYGVARVAKTKAINTYQSGPASGVRGAHVLSRQAKQRRVLTIDVGGTTTDVSSIAGGQPVAARFRPIQGVEVAQRIPDIVSFGLGGDSKIALAGKNRITVGPDSQGAVPGPVCFGLGGSVPTPTDVWLALGYLSPDRYLGGRKKLQRDSAVAAIEKTLGKPRKLDAIAAALAAKEAVEATLADHITNNAPLDDAGAAGATLYSVGGGAGLLAVGLAEKLDLGAVYFPANAAVFSAFGASTLDVTHGYEEIIARRRKGSPPADILARLKEQAVRDMRGEGFTQDQITYHLEAECYAGQNQVGGVPPVKAGRGFPKKVADILAKPPRGTEYTIVRLIATCPIPHPQIAATRKRARSAKAALDSTRRLHLSADAIEAPVYRFDRLPLTARVAGPAIIEDDHTSILLPDGHSFRMDDLGNGIVEL
jgi:N-methylhydantoinase A/acetophenone carboxylase